MGLDVGTKTIGVSVSDELGWTAQSVEVIRRNRSSDYMARLGELIEQFEVGRIVVGLPKNMNGTIGETGQACQSFADNLRDTFRLPVEMWDERLSSRAAEQVLLEGNVSRHKRKQVIDRVAATVILQAYLDARKDIR